MSDLKVPGFQVNSFYFTLDDLLIRVIDRHQRSYLLLAQRSKVPVT